MRHDEAGTTPQQRDERLLQSRFRERIDRAGRLVEDHQPRIGQQRPRETHELALADRQSRTALAHFGMQPLRQRFQQIKTVELLRGRAHLGFRRLGSRKPEVGQHRAAEEKILLRHHAQLPVERITGDRPHFASIDEQLAARR